jgi:hypothetical protein
VHHVTLTSKRADIVAQALIHRLSSGW